MLVLLLIAALNINHQPVDCLVRSQFSRISATVEPAAQAAEVRLYFKSGATENYFFVPMELQRGEFVGILPRPRSGQVTYFIAAWGEGSAGSRMAAPPARVVNDQMSCTGNGRVATVATGPPIIVYATTRSTSKPAGFDGVLRVTPATAQESAAYATRPQKPAEQTPVEQKPVEQKPVEQKPAEQKPAAPAPRPAAASPSVVAVDPAPIAPKGAAPEYLIGPGDILKIVVYGQDQLTQSVVVQHDGSFTYPLVGRIQAADLAPDELQRRITVLLARDYVRNPLVTVSVQEYRSKTVFVVGQIAKPGNYPLERNTTLVSILAMAGPVTGNAVEAVIVRPAEAVEGPVLPTDVSPDVRKATIMRVSLRDIETGQIEKNVVLQANDTVFIPQAPAIFVSGEVRSPGGYAWRPGLTVRQAISLAGGFTERSSSRIRVVRDVNGKAKEVKIGLDDRVGRDDQIIVKAKLF